MATNPQWQIRRPSTRRSTTTRTLGRHSVKTGFEYQTISHRGPDVNPLYGRDEYSGASRGRWARPAPTPLNLADFMFARAQPVRAHELLHREPEANMYFAYVQARLQDPALADPEPRPALRIRDAALERRTPDQLRPNTRTMIQARDGSLEDRALVKPDRNNWAPRLGFAWSVTPKTVIRGAYGNQLHPLPPRGRGQYPPHQRPTQVINAVINQTNPPAGTFRPRSGFPAGSRTPRASIPCWPTSRTPNDYHSSRVQSWFVSAQRELSATVIDVPTSATGPATCSCRELTRRGRTSRAEPRPAAARPIPTFGDITYAFNGASRATTACRSGWSAARGRSHVLTRSPSRAVDNGAGTLEAPNGNFPSPQDFNTWRRRGEPRPTTSRSTTRERGLELPIGHGRSGAPACRAWARRRGRLAAGGHQQHGSGEPINFQYAPWRLRRCRDLHSRTSAARRTIGPRDRRPGWRPRISGR